MKTRKTRLTPDDLRKYPGNEHHTDAEAENIIASLEKFAQITYKIYQDELKRKSNEKENVSEPQKS